MLDIIIRGGWIADGTGNPIYPADVAIERDLIVKALRITRGETR